MNLYKKKQTVTVLKRELNVISNALKMSEVDNGEMATWNFGDISFEENTKVFAEQYFIPYIKTIKTCVPVSDECWAHPYALSGKKIPSYLGFASYHGAAILNDGSSVLFWANNPLDGSVTHAQITIDINGPKKGPNTYGKDVFRTRILFDTSSEENGKLWLYGLSLKRDEMISDPLYGCTKNIDTNTSGLYCGALIQYDNWEIKDDYPW